MTRSVTDGRTHGRTDRQTDRRTNRRTDFDTKLINPFSKEKSGHNSKTTAYERTAALSTGGGGILLLLKHENVKLAILKSEQIKVFCF